MVHVALLVLLAMGAGSLFAQDTSETSKAQRLPIFARYENPLKLNDPRTGSAVSCPDPTIIKQRVAVIDYWYLYCTGDALNSNDKNADGSLKNHLIASYRSVDLVNWTYIGDVFQTLPSWIGNVNINLWAAAIKYFNNRYYLYYTAPNTAIPGSAIGVATSDSPAGPWTDSGRPVIAPAPNPYNGSPGRAVIDPDVIEDDAGQRYISFGSFNGGISIRKLSADGLISDPSSQEQIAIDNTYEGAAFWKRGGYYYLFLSTAGCCNGPLSGYSVTVARSQSVTGPYLDKNGVSVNTFAPGGSISIAANGNKWVGPGGNVVFEDNSGRDYMLYHAIDVQSPYFDGYPGFTKRPAMIDPIDWIDDWPQVRGGYWASASLQPGPAAQRFQFNLYYPRIRRDDLPGELITGLSDEFNSSTLSPQWRFIHPNANNTFALTGSAYQVETRGAEQIIDPQNVAILAEPTPADGDYLVETKVTTSVPFNDSCCYNFAQGALFIYGNDQNSIKLDIFPNFNTRQTEFGKQIGPVPERYPTYDRMTIGPAATTTWLRILKRGGSGGPELYTAYTSNDGVNWTRGGTWQHNLGSGAQIGIAAQNTPGFTMDFDYVRVYRLQPRWLNGLNAPLMGEEEPTGPAAVR